MSVGVSEGDFQTERLRLFLKRKPGVGQHDAAPSVYLNSVAIVGHQLAGYLTAASRDHSLHCLYTSLLSHSIPLNDNRRCTLIDADRRGQLFLLPAFIRGYLRLVPLA